MFSLSHCYIDCRCALHSWIQQNWVPDCCIFGTEARLEVFPVFTVAMYTLSFVIIVMYYCIVYLAVNRSSSHVLMGALGHTLMPSCFVDCQFFSFFPADDVHVLEVSVNDVHPVFPGCSGFLLQQFAVVLIHVPRSPSGIIWYWPCVID